MVSPSLLYVDLVALAESLGVLRVGVADLALLADMPTNPPGLLAPYRRGISLVMRLPEELPPEYARLFPDVERRLDQAAAQVAQFIQGRGYRALAVPVNEVLQGYSGALSHRAVAQAAGLGQIDAGGQFTVPGIGPRIRLATVLTDALLPLGSPAAGG